MYTVLSRIYECIRHRAPIDSVLVRRAYAKCVKARFEKGKNAITSATLSRSSVRESRYLDIKSSKAIATVLFFFFLHAVAKRDGKFARNRILPFIEYTQEFHHPFDLSRIKSE